MIIYRPHRELLYEALEAMKEFESIDEMKQYVSQLHDDLVSVDDIFLDKRVIKDDRIGWNDTRYVCAKKFGDDDVIGIVIGLCATDYDYDKTIAYLKEQQMIEKQMIEESKHET